MKTILICLIIPALCAAQTCMMMAGDTSSNVCTPNAYGGCTKCADGYQKFNNMCYAPCPSGWTQLIPGYCINSTIIQEHQNFTLCPTSENVEMTAGAGQFLCSTQNTGGCQCAPKFKNRLIIWQQLTNILKQNLKKQCPNIAIQQKYDQFLLQATYFKYFKQTIIFSDYQLQNFCLIFHLLLLFCQMIANSAMMAILESQYAKKNGIGFLKWRCYSYLSIIFSKSPQQYQIKSMKVILLAILLPVLCMSNTCKILSSVPCGLMQTEGSCSACDSDTQVFNGYCYPYCPSGWTELMPGYCINSTIISQHQNFTLCPSNLTYSAGGGSCTTYNTQCSCAPSCPNNYVSNGCQCVYKSTTSNAEVSHSDFMLYSLSFIGLLAIILGGAYAVKKFLDNRQVKVALQSPITIEASSKYVNIVEFQ